MMHCTRYSTYLEITYSSISLNTLKYIATQIKVSTLVTACVEILSYLRAIYVLTNKTTEVYLHQHYCLVYVQVLFMAHILSC